MSTTRKDVYTAIDLERDYQDQHTLREDPDFIGYPTGAPFTQGEYIVMMQHYVNELPKLWALNPGDVVEKVQHNMRKIAGIAVQCMEYHGAPSRVGVGDWGDAAQRYRDEVNPGSQKT